MQGGAGMFRLGMAALMAASIFAGTSGVRLYPVEGPLSMQAPAPVFEGKMHGNTHGGTFSFTLADGEVCTGRWIYHSESKDIAPEQLAGLHAAWDTVYGQGFYTAQVLGESRLASGTGTTGKGMKLAIEVVFPAAVGPNSPSTGSTKGVAVDSQGNVFKLALRAARDKS
jgi:hypothetical protein